MIVFSMFSQTCLAWSSSTYLNQSNSIQAGEFGLTLSYVEDIETEFLGIGIAERMELSRGTSYYIESTPSEDAELYYALEIIFDEEEGIYYLGYIASVGEIDSEDYIESTIANVSNEKTQYTKITISESSDSTYVIEIDTQDNLEDIEASDADSEVPTE